MENLDWPSKNNKVLLWATWIKNQTIKKEKPVLGSKPPPALMEMHSFAEGVHISMSVSLCHRLSWGLTIHSIYIFVECHMLNKGFHEDFSQLRKAISRQILLIVLST